MIAFMKIDDKFQLFLSNLKKNSLFGENIFEFDFIRRHFTLTFVTP